MTDQQLRGFVYVMYLALDDQENYVDSGNPCIDYDKEGLELKAEAMSDAAEAAYSLGQTNLGERFKALADEFRMLAESIAA